MGVEESAENTPVEDNLTQGNLAEGNLAEGNLAEGILAPDNLTSDTPARKRTMVKRLMGFVVICYLALNGGIPIPPWELRQAANKIESLDFYEIAKVNGQMCAGNFANSTVTAHPNYLTS